jgi:hypothetical protein
MENFSLKPDQCSQDAKSVALDLVQGINNTSQIREFSNGLRCHIDRPIVVSAMDIWGTVP